MDLTLGINGVKFVSKHRFLFKYTSYEGPNLANQKSRKLEVVL